MKIRHLVFVALIFCMNVVFAAPLQNIETTITQPDGSVLHCFISGDEFFNRLHDAEGYTIIQAPNGYFVYATTDDEGNIIPSEHIVGKVDPKTIDVKPNIVLSKKEYLKERDRMKLSGPKNRSSLNHGVYNNLAVFIKFKGDNDLTTTTSNIELMLNGDGYFDVSMNNYYKKMTYNKLAMHSYLFPEPDEEQLLAYEDIYPREYYLPYNETTNPTGYVDHADRSARQFSMLKRAIEFIADDVPNNINLDRNNDGLVDNVIFIVKGNVSGWSTLLWPHCWEMGEGYDAYINGKKVYSFNFQLETSDKFTVSALCHEMGHSLGFPDLYHYNEDAEHLAPVGQWDLMATNTEPPQHTATYMKYKYGTWIDEIPEITEYGTYTIEANSWEGGRRNCYKIASPEPDQFYLIEYRNDKTFFEQTLPDGGLLIYRIDTRQHGSQNYDGEFIYDEIYIFRPGGSHDNSGNLISATFSENDNRTVFNHTTNAYPFLNKHIIDEEFNICNISKVGDNMTFTYCPINTEIVPKNLIVNIEGIEKDVELRWQNVEEADSYNIYRDGTLIASNVKENSYIDKYSKLTDGYHEYYVTSKCGNQESFHSNEEYVIIGEYCEYVIDMTTSGEYGWQGGEIKLTFNNKFKDSYHTLYSGNNNTQNIVVPSNINMSLNWLSSWDDSQCSFIIKNNGENIYTSSGLKEGLLKNITTKGTTAVTPKNLTATTENTCVHLSWTTYVETESFTIMRDGEIIADNVKGCHYIDKDISYSGTHRYNVIANNAGHSSKPTETVIASVMIFDHNDLILNNEGTDNNVNLNWNTTTLEQGVLRYDDGNYVTNIGSNSNTWGIRIPAEYLTTFEGTQILSIEIYDNYDGKYSFNIYNGESIDKETLIHTEDFNTTAANKFVRFELSEKIDFDTTKDLWITAKASGGSGSPIPCGEFHNDPNCNLIKIGKYWESATPYNMAYSWLLRAYTTTPENYALTYNLYRNNEVIASDLTTTTYTETLNTTDKTCYNVQAVYNGIVVAKSNNVCINDPDGVDESFYRNADIYPNPVKDILYISTPDMRNITIATITGSVMLNQDVKDDKLSIDVNDFNKGIYILRISTSTETITEKIVVY